MKALPRQGTQEVWYQVNFYQEKQSPIHKNILTYALLCLSWFNSSWQLSTTEPIPEKTPGLSQWQFNGWRKSCMHKQSRARSSFSTSQVGVQPCPGQWGPSHVGRPRNYWGMPSQTQQFSPSFLQIYVLSMMFCGVECPSGHFGSAVLVLLPPSLLGSSSQAEQGTCSPWLRGSSG